MLPIFHVFIAPVCRIYISSTRAFANYFHLFFSGVDYNSARSLEPCLTSICWLCDSNLPIYTYKWDIVRLCSGHL